MIEEKRSKFVLLGHFVKCQKLTIESQSPVLGSRPGGHSPDINHAAAPPRALLPPGETQRTGGRWGCHVLRVQCSRAPTLIPGTKP